MYPTAESKAKVVYKEPLFVEEDYSFKTVFIREAMIEENTASECICTESATYASKLLQLYEYEANDYGYEAMWEWYPKNTSSCSIKGRRLSGWGLSA